MKYLTTDEAAEIIRTTSDYVARKCASGEIAAKKVGASWRIHPSALDAFMAPGKAEPTRYRRRAS